MSEQKTTEINQNEKEKSKYTEQQIKQGLKNSKFFTVKPTKQNVAPFWKFFDKIAHIENEQQIIIKEYVICNQCHELYSYKG